MKNNKKIIIVITHIALWAILISAPFIFTQRPADEPIKYSNHFIVNFISNNVYLVLFYYLNTLVLIPKLLVSRKWGWYILTVVACFIGFLYIPREISLWITGPDDTMKRFMDAVAEQGKKFPKMGGGGPGGPRPKSNWFFAFNSKTAIYFLVYTVGTCIAVVQRWFKTDEVRKEVETEKLNTELSFLKTQINPHFFFNTLNNIYSLAVVKSEQTAPTVMKLSSIMRYILSDTQANHVPLENEIDFLKNFIDLQSVRLTDKVHVNFTVSGEPENKQVAPLLLIPFVENAFKYGVSTKENTNIDISLKATDDKISFFVTNIIVSTDHGIIDGTGIGINNVKRRLELLYHEKHTLITKKENNQFIVQLDILLK